MLEDEELDAVALESTRTSTSTHSYPRIRSIGSGTTRRIISCPATRSAKKLSRSSAKRW
jgi:hypothetical protein